MGKALFPLVVAGTLLVTNWKADTEKAKIEFSVKGLFGTVHGSFAGLKSTILFDEKDLAASSISASLDAKTVSTGIGLRNHHLREEEQFLDADKYPTIGFRTKKIVKSGAGYLADGELTIKTVTRPVQISFTFHENGGNDAIFKGDFSIKRLDYNIGKPGGSIGEIITIHLEVPVTK
jgi:polyisoprenoid-binding protein YceI